MWNFFKEQIDRALRTLARVLNPFSVTGNQPAPHDNDGFDPALLEAAIQASLNENVGPYVDPSFNELDFAVQIPSLQNHPDNQETEETILDAFSKLNQFLFLLNIDQDLIDDLAQKFNEYIEKFPVTSKIFRDSKSIEDISEEYINLTDLQQELLRNDILGKFNNSSFTFINKINAIILLFYRHTKLEDVCSQIPGQQNHAPQASANLNINSAPIPLVFSPNATATLPAPSSNSSSNQSLTPEERQKIERQEICLRRAIAFDLKLAGENIGLKLEEFQQSTDYENCDTFDKKSAAIKQQFELLEKEKISKCIEASSSETSNLSEDSKGPQLN